MRKFFNHLLTTAISLSFALAAYSQTGGTPDLSFNASDTVLYKGEGMDYFINASVEQANNQLVVAGSFTWFENYSHLGRIARLTSDGYFDLTFNAGTGADSTILSMVLQPDGKILIAGMFSNYNGNAASYIARLNSDGSFDSSFSMNGAPDSTVRSILLQPDGRILIAGDFANCGGAARIGIARLNADGSLDTSFDALANASGQKVHVIALQNDGKIVAASQDQSNADFRVFRLVSDGSADSGFTEGNVEITNSGLPKKINVIGLQPDGKIIVGGNFSLYNDATCNGIAKLNTDGSFDSSFVQESQAVNGNIVVNSLQIKSDGKIIAGGTYSGSSYVEVNYLKQLNADGSQDTSFDSFLTGKSSITYIVRLADGSIFVTGYFAFHTYTARNRYAMLNADGSLVTDYNAGASFNGDLRVTVLQPDGKIIVGGFFTAYKGIPAFHIARINADGSADDTFNAGNNVPDLVNAIVLQPDGKILVAYSDNYFVGSGAYTGKVIRLNSDGSPDPTFSTDVSGGISAMAIQADGKVIITGDFYTCNGVSAYRIARLNTDGSTDTGFITGGGPQSGDVVGIIVQSSGKIVLAGSFLSFNYETNHYIIRLNTDGSIDNSFSQFNPPTAPITSICSQPDGKMIIGGAFDYYSSNYVHEVARVNVNGTLDESFSSPEDLDAPEGTTYNFVSFLACMPNGKVIIARTYYNTTVYANSELVIRRFKSNGTPDDEFTEGHMTFGSVRSLVPAGENSFLVAGSFGSYNNIGRTRIARIWNTASPEVYVFTTPAYDGCNGKAFVTAVGTPGFTYDIGNGAPVSTSSPNAEFDNLCAGIYSVLLTQDNGDTVSTVFVIDDDTNYVYDPFDENTVIIDSYSAVIENCDIDYQTVDSVYISSYELLAGDSLYVVWAIQDASGTTSIPVTYYLSGGSGNYYIQLQLYCPEKSTGNYLVATYGFHYENGHLSWLGVSSKELSDLEIFPNPTTGKVKVHMDENGAVLIVRDINGKLLQTKPVAAADEIDLSGFADGVYLLELSTENAKAVRRIIKN